MHYLFVGLVKNDSPVAQNAATSLTAQPLRKTLATSPTAHLTCGTAAGN
jgi:hypothetical protein